MHARVLGLVAALAVLVALPSGAVVAADAADPEERLEEVEEELDRTRAGLEDIEQERDVTLEDLERLDAELVELDANLAALQSELGVAQTELEDAERRLAATTSELAATEQRLADTQDRLDDERDTFADRTRASFMYGGPAQMSTSMFDAGDMAQFGRALQYVRQVLASDRDRVHLVSGFVREIEADTVELGVLQERQADEQAAAEQERDRVAGLVEEERSLREQVAATRGERQAALNALDSDREQHVALLDSLEDESERLEEELRRLAEEERRRREEEERRRQAEEERRQAEEERRRQAEEERRQEEQRRTAAAADRQQRSSASSSGGGSASASSAPAAEQQAPAGRLQRPADGRVTSGYGYRIHPIFGTRRFHAGVDFGGGHGAPIYAAEAGTVVSAGARGGYGMTIVIDHGQGLTTLYAHQSRFAVAAGQRVSRGQVIGYIGATGVATGPHLHFEVRVNGSTRNPMSYL